MALNLELKKNLVKEVSDILSQAETVMTADYRGLTSNELNEFRKLSRQSDIFVKVVKNNMLKMALKNSEFSTLGEKVIGPQILAVSKNNLGEFAKLVKKFVDNHENIKIKSLSYKGNELDVSEVKKLASLPSYDEAISMLLSVMQAPIQKLLATMNAIPTKVVRTFEAIRQSKN